MESGNSTIKCGRNMAMQTELFKFTHIPSKVRKNNN
jgi:hypothetical protein